MPYFLFFLWQSTGAALGWWLAGPWGAAAGTSAAAWLCFAWNRWCGARVLAWMRAGTPWPADAPRVRAAMWGEAAERISRLVRQSQRSAQASHARLQEMLAALQASPDGVTLLDAQGRIEWCNQVAQAHFGIALARDAAQSIGNLVRDPHFSAYYDSSDLTHGVVLPGRASTPAHPVRLRVHLHPYGGGKRLLLSRDVTALEQAQALRRDFVANVSHEIRTPLTVLTGFVETLQTLALTEAERTHYLALMAGQARRMQQLVQDLLTLSRLETAPAPDAGRRASVATLLRHCEDEARALSAITTQGLQHIAFPAPEALQAAGDIAGEAAELQSAFANLVNNAVRYTPAGGSITVSWELLENGGARFAVRDSGVGIAPEHLPRITERFYRVDASRARAAAQGGSSSGTGLGLSIVKHVVQRHDGVLHIHSVPGQGSTFSVELPPQRIHGPHTPLAGDTS